MFYWKNPVTTVRQKYFKILKVKCSFDDHLCMDGAGLSIVFQLEMLD
jgi:hypothetical protein